MYKNLKNYFLIFTLIFWGWSVSVRAAASPSSTTTTTETDSTRVDDSTRIDDTKVDHPMDDDEATRVDKHVRTRTETTSEEPVLTPSKNEVQASRKGGGLFVEPGITYESLDTNINWPTPFSSSTGSVRGVGLMGRLGFHANETLFLAVDGRYVKPTFNDSSTNVDTNASLYDYGPIVGIQMPFAGMRLWGQYVAGGQLDSSEQHGLDYRFDQSRGYRIGAGFHVQAVSLNLEYQDLSYRTSVQSAAGFTADANFDTSDLNSKGVIASISFPFGL